MTLERYLNRTTVIPERTGYQLRHFIIGQHDTAPMQWRQLLLEAQDLAYKMRIAELDIEKKRIQIHRLMSSGDPIEAIEAEELELGIVLTERALAGARVEWAELERLAEQIGSYTLDEIEADQADYWRMRLNRQAGLEQLGAQQGISAANLQSMLNAGVLQKGDDPCAISPGD